MKEFRRTSRSVWDLSFIDSMLVGANGIVYCGKLPIVNISTMGVVTRNKFYPACNTEHNWGLLNGAVYSKIPEAEEALFAISSSEEAVRDWFSAGQFNMEPDETSPMFVSVIANSSRASKCRWLGKFKPELSDESRRKSGKSPVSGSELDTQMALVIEKLKKDQS